MKTRPLPCAECPWRKDTAPGQFPPERYEALRETATTEVGHPELTDPMFACHKSKEDKELPCAGWLASVGLDHVRIRLAAACGEIDASRLHPGDGWPELYESYEDLMAVHGRGTS